MEHLLVEQSNSTMLQDKAHENLIKSFVMINVRTVANENKSNRYKRGKAIVTACDKILAGKHVDQFVVDMINSGLEPHLT